MTHPFRARRWSIGLPVAALALLALPMPVPAADPVHQRSERTASRDLPFSDVVRVGDLLFLSGQLGTRPDGSGLAEGGIEAEARQTMENIRAIVVAAGSSMDRVVKCTVFLADMADWPAFNEVYRGFFPANALPARSALGANGLALGALVEVECIAAAGATPTSGE